MFIIIIIYYYYFLILCDRLQFFWVLFAIGMSQLLYAA